MHFAVDDLTVRPEGWSVGIAVTNATHSTFELGVNTLAFGLMLFATGALEEVEKANRERRMPSPRLATTMKPEPPDLLVPGATWRATLSGHGSLADESWVRVAFGPFRAVGDPPPGMRPVLYWITDHAYQL